MLEKPNLEDDVIVNSLQTAFGLKIAGIEFLPLGADRDTAVYRAIADDETPYFVKLRSGSFDAMTIIVPKLLCDQGNPYVIAPLVTPSGELWTTLGAFKLMVFPYVEGRNGYDMRLDDHHWIELGRALKMLHTAAIPRSIIDRIQRETYSDHWREAVRGFQQQIAMTTFSDPVAAELAAFLKSKDAVMSQLIERAEYLASVLQTRPQSYILCHADIHAANLLIDADDHFYIVDWDTLIMAPKERDLMFIGGGQYDNQRSPQAEETVFYQGYGPTQADLVGLAYYRYERVVQDISAYCEEVFLTEGDGADRKNGARRLIEQFQPNSVIELAYRSEQLLPPEHRL